MFSDPELIALVSELSELLLIQKKKLVLAESCTGGLMASLVTELAGSSKIFERGYVTYSNAAKQTLLGVPLTILETKGAVSAECAEAMATGALKNSRAHIALSVTGIAGPGGATPVKPVGLVYIGLATEGYSQAYEYRFTGTRSDIRGASCREGFRLLIEALSPSLMA
ncbi:MAG: CinA family protein [Rhodospirillales bacterium]|nr:CinA family protein [Alphaproteobacteria bacterium]MCB1839973.1 CinA family protein [Alphaproteobacteria bacterium]MCB9977806.1 CinA family protein [Rhodospirillales bacterium]